MSGNLPPPLSPLENSFFQIAESLKSIDKRLDRIEKKVDTSISLARSSQGETRLLSRDVSNFIGTEQGVRSDIAEIRRNITDQHLKIAIAGQQLGELRDDTEKIRENTDRHDLPTEEELAREREKRGGESGKVVESALVLYKTGQKHWGKLSIIGSTIAGIHWWEKLAAVAHAIGRWFGG